MNGDITLGAVAHAKKVGSSKSMILKIEGSTDLIEIDGMYLYLLAQCTKCNDYNIIVGDRYTELFELFKIYLDQFANGFEHAEYFSGALGTIVSIDEENEATVIRRHVVNGNRDHMRCQHATQYGVSGEPTYCWHLKYV